MTENINPSSAYNPLMSTKHNPQPKLPRGFYVATLTAIDSAPSRYGTAMIRMRWQLNSTSPTSGPLTYVWRVPLTSEDIHKLAQVNKALGFATPSLPRLLGGEDTIEPSIYMGGRALLHLGPEVYQGKWRSVIEEIRPMAQAVAFQALMREEEPTL